MSKIDCALAAEKIEEKIKNEKTPQNTAGSFPMGFDMLVLKIRCLSYFL